MLKSYFVAAVRNLFRSKYYSLINILGLGVAMALCVAGYVNYQFSQSFDSYHKNKNNIYAVSSYKIVNNERQNWSYIPMPMAPALKKDIPGIIKFSRVSVGVGTMIYGDKVLREAFYFVDEDFFKMFTFPLILKGGKSWDKSSIIITDEIAHKYFGDENPIGKQVVINPDNKGNFVFTVFGVIEKPPKNSSLQMTVCLPYENVKEMLEFDPDDWDHWARGTFVQLEDNVSAAEIEKQLQEFIPHTSEANPEWSPDGFYMIPLTQLAFVTRELYGNPYTSGMHPAAIIAPSVTALLVLLLACFNFINTSIAFATRRLKEIGIRKVMGGMRRQLVMQFIGENLVLCFVALIVAAVFAEIFVPAYDSLWPEISLTMNYLQNPELILFLIGLLLFTSIAAGAYPAFYISAYNPINIFRGKQKLGGSNPLVRILLVFQFALSITAIIAAMILGNNAEYIRNLDLGFDRENILVIPINGEDKYTRLKSAIENHPDIVSIGGSHHLMGRFLRVSDAEYEGTTRRSWIFGIGDNFLETVGFKLVDGHGFNSDSETSDMQTVIVNDMLVKEFGWKSALDKFITMELADEKAEYRVVGVVKDFYPNGVSSKILPTVLYKTPAEDYQYLSLKYSSNDKGNLTAYIGKEWEKLFPQLPFRSFGVEDILAEDAQTTESIRLVFLYIAVMVVIISGMGLIALVSLNIARRTKEIGIRKVLGATAANIGMLISKEFAYLVIIASVLGSVIAYFLVGSLMSSIWEYYVAIGPVPFILSAVIFFCIALLTVTFQIINIATTNPVEAIKYE